jgi:hypothetical protein
VKLTSLSLALACLVSVMVEIEAQATIGVQDLRCEYRVNPLGIDKPYPAWARF